jgi:hypothetical protein
MTPEPSRARTPYGGWYLLEFLLSIPLALWLLNLFSFPWNLVVLAVMLFPLPFYFIHRKKQATRQP